MFLYLCVFMYVCFCICVCSCVYVSLSVCVFMYVCFCICVCSCMYVSVSVCIHLCTFLYPLALCRWLPSCAALFIERKDLWQHLVPDNDTESTLLVQQYFACIAALMSLHLRSIVINSLIDFLDFLKIHEVCRLQYL